MITRKDTDYVWYAEARDAITNEIIAKELNETSICCGTVCADGIMRDLWQCDHRFVNKLVRNRIQLGLNFMVFNQKGRYGKVRRWVF